MFSTFCLIVLLVSNILLIYLTLSSNRKLVRANSTNLLLKESYATLLSKYNKLTRLLPKTSPPPLPTNLTSIVDKLIKTTSSKKTKKSETSHSNPSSLSHYDYSGGYSSCSSGDSGSSSCDSGSSGGSYD